MYSYALLEKGCYYLIQEKEDKHIHLMRINMETDTCMLVTRFEQEQSLEWKKKTDSIFDIIELLSDEAVASWQAAYNANFYYEEEDDEMD
jgi:uncharacterized membrane protein (UPF0127 family)